MNVGKNMSMNKEKHTIVSPCDGEVVRLEDVCDEVFSQGILGKGFAVIPSNNDFFSPIDGKISNAYETCHAYTIEGKDGLELLVHIGVDTVELAGEYFSPVVKANMSVSQGDKLAYADTDNILARGFDPITVVIITNTEKLGIFKITYGKVKAKDSVMEYSLKEAK